MAGAGNETVFTWRAPAVKFGPGAVGEVGHDVAALGCRRVLVVTDQRVAATGAAGRATEAVRQAGVDATVYADVHIEPTDVGVRAAADAVRDGGWDGFVAVGGGSVIDTAKAVNLLTHVSGDLLDYVNAPIGGGRSPENPLAPLVAVPTTAGTGAECTAVCVVDLLEQHVKSGISDAALRPALAVVDPELTLSLPPEVTAASAFDVLCHALESYTARPYSDFPRHAPEARVAYCGANPVSDLWIERTMPLLARSVRTAVADGSDLAARTDLHLAALFAGMGFGNAGVHIPHACAYPIAGRVREYVPNGYLTDSPLVPHGQSVVLTAPATFARTFASSPDRHAWAATTLDPSVADLPDKSSWLPTAIRRLMRDTGVPSGLVDVGYGEADIDGLVEGALAQQRLLGLAPVPVDADLLAEVFRSSIQPVG
ncbi:MAG: hydroxyacid-oxoacid transhydrogenase [Streptosporangiales bacterium]